MHLDVSDLIAFYDTPLGRISRQLVGARLGALWPRVGGMRVLGLGYAGPYLQPFQAEAERVLAVAPAATGVTAWPGDGRQRVCLAAEDQLPLPDAAVDRILLVHALEVAEDPERLLRELWRVLAPGGRILAVVPNRSGLWARAETTPFGTGRPYSRRQLDRQLSDALFSPAAWDEALFLPPWPRRFLMSSARAWERVGKRAWPAFGGVLLVEAEKRMWMGIPAKRKSRRVPVLVPVPAAVARREPLPPGAGVLGGG
ncbi:class I SAM-dependent methyltransferase [Pseudoxanthobacter sp. M-2]|uniref:class I SAM-dependent methyltransferase n=1 Tax=Pseudoxanthobacter sp. M-2 TaxID=3078754 RepID=UPI0038FBF489